MAVSTSSWRARYGVAIGTTILALLARWSLDGIFGDRAPFLFFILAVTVTAWYGGFWPSQAANVLGLVGADYFFLQPRYSLAVLSKADFFEMSGYLGLGLVIAYVVQVLRAAQSRAESYAGEALDRQKRLEREIFQRTQSEEAARQQREWLRVTLASIGDAVIATDTQGRVAFLNGMAQSLTGWSQDEATGKALAQVFPIINERTREPAENPVERVLREGAVIGLANHTVLLGRTGAAVPIDDSAAPIRGANGEVVGTVLVFRDVTERRRAEEVLQESEARKTAILETALDAIITIDHDGKVVEFNPAAERMFGYGRADAVGREIGDLIVPPGLRASHREGLARYLATGKGSVLDKRIEMPALRRDGKEFPVELAITRISTDGPPMFTAYLRDLTERKNWERRRGARLAVVQTLAQAADIRELSAGILQTVCDNLGWDVGVVWLLDAPGQVLRCFDSRHSAALPVEPFLATCRDWTFHSGEGLPGRVWASGKPAWIRDLSEDGNFPRSDTAIGAGLHGAFGFPVNLGQQTLGVVEFFSREVREPDDDLLEMMTTLGSQIGQFIERQRAEEEMRKFKILSDGASEAHFLLDRDARFTYVNQTACERLGYTADELPRLRLADIAPLDAEENFQAFFARGRAERVVPPFESLHQRKDGTSFPVEVRVSVTELGGELFLFVIAQDITERKRAEDALRAREKRFRLLIERSWEAIALIDTTGTFRYASPAVTRILGFAVEEFVGRDAFDFMHPDHLEHTQSLFVELVAQPGEIRMAQFLYRHKDGSYRWVEAIGVNLLTEADIQAIVINFRDITERKQADEKLRDQRQWLESILNLMPTPLLLIEPSSARVTFANRAANAMAGGEFPKDKPAAEYHTIYHCTDAQGRRIPNEEMPGVRVARGERLAGFEMDWHLPSGVRSILIHADTLPSLHGHPAICLMMFQDVSRLKRVEADLRAADRAKDEFLATLAHELRNPLVPLRNALYLLRRPNGAGADLEQTGDLMERHVHHMVRLIDDLLDVSRITRGKIELRTERVELATAVATALETSRPLIEAAGQELTVSLPSEPLFLDADLTRLAQVLANLLNNASKYTDAGGHVWLEAWREGAEAVLQVRDTGIGIPNEMLPRIFDMFTQVNQARDGLGIGLTLARRLVEMHGGQIEAYSPGIGKGSTFVVRLPLLQKDEGGRMKDEKKTEDNSPSFNLQPSSLPLRILVVDDVRDSAETLAMILRLYGHEVHLAFDGPGALEAAVALRPDIVLLDIGLPGMTGHEVAHHLRAEHGLTNMVLIALTGWGQEEDRRRSREVGIAHHLVKPVDPETLHQLLASLAPAARN